MKQEQSQPGIDDLEKEVAELRAQLDEAQETLRAIREGEVDAIVVTGHQGERVFSLTGAESVYRQIIETMNEAAVTVTLDGDILFANAQFGALMKRPLEQVLGHKLNEFVSPDDRLSLAALLGRSRTADVKQRLVFRNAEGKDVPTHVSANVLNQPDGMSICLVAADLTELENSTHLIQQLRSQKEELRQSEGRLFVERQRLQALMNASPVGLSFSDDTTCKRITGNPALAAQYEVSPNVNISASGPDDSLGRRIRYFHEGRELTDVELPLQRAVAENREIPPMELEVVMPNGRRWFAEASAAPVRNSEGKVIAGLAAINDITARKQAEQALKELNETLERRVKERTAEVQRMADQLRALAADLSQTEQRERRRLANILHDHIQQLLVAARMQLERLKRDNDQERISAIAQEVNGILQEAIDASRSLAVELSPPILKQSGLIGGLHWLVSNMMEKYHLTVHLRTDDSAEPATEEARCMIFECARELLLNIVKHAGVLEANVNLVRSKDNHINLIVRDYGKGFDPYLLECSSAQDTFGLFSIQQRLAHIGGKAEIKSMPEKGTSITLTLPATEAQPIAARPVAEEAVAADDEFPVQAKAGCHRVLVVDDHKIMREGLAGLIKFEPDIEVVGQAADGQTAIQMVETLHPDVVIMDVNLGEMDGVEATKKIVARNPRTKVIGLSMIVDDDVAMAMREAGAFAYLTKGGRSEDLIGAIRNAQT